MRAAGTVACRRGTAPNAFVFAVPVHVDFIRAARAIAVRAAAAKNAMFECADMLVDFIGAF